MKKIPQIANNTFCLQSTSFNLVSGYQNFTGIIHMELAFLDSTIESIVR